MRRAVRPAAVILGLACVAAACSSNKPSVSVSPLARTPGGVKPPPIVYVVDFYLDPAMIEEAKGPADKVGKTGGPLKTLRGEIKSIREGDPASKARELVSLLSETIAKELAEEGLRAEHLRSHSRTLPGTVPAEAAGFTEGWLITGWFEKVVENTPAAEATVGFGAGSGQVSIEVEVADLAGDPRKPFLSIGSASGRHKKPGGVVTLSPYVMAAKFVMARGETEKDVKKQGAAIAQSVIKYVKEGGAEKQPAPPSP